MISDTDYSLLNDIGTPVFVLEPTQTGALVYVAWNNAARDGSGLTLEDVRGKTAHILYPGRAGLNTYELHQHVAETLRPQTYDVTLSFGTEAKRIRTTLTPHLAEDGTLLRLVGTSRNIHAEETLRQTEAVIGSEKMMVAEEIESFVALAAHDLRAPIRHVSSLASMLRDGFHDHGDGKLEMIGQLEDVALKAGRLIDDVVEYTRSQKSPDSQETVDLGALCSDLFMVLDPASMHTLQVDECKVHVERVPLEICLRNLVKNAMKHARRDRVRVLISVAKHDDHMLSFAVRDDGEGFVGGRDPLKSVPGARSKAGFGLMTIGRLLAARGGVISARNASWRGKATVRFTYPGRLLS